MTLAAESSLQFLLSNRLNEAAHSDPDAVLDRFVYKVVRALSSDLRTLANEGPEAYKDSLVLVSRRGALRSNAAWPMMRASIFSLCAPTE